MSEEVGKEAQPEAAQVDNDARLHLSRVLKTAIAAKRAQPDPDRHYPSDDQPKPSTIKDGKWLSLNAVDPVTGRHPLNRSSADDLLFGRTLAPSEATMRAIADLLFGGDDSIVYIASAISRGMKPPRRTPAGGTWASSLPGWVDDLPEGAKGTLRDVVFQLGVAYDLV